MRGAFILAGLFVCVATSGGEFSLQLPATRRSQQFIVHDGRPESGAFKSSILGKRGPEMIALNPDVLIVSAERIREELNNEFGLGSRGAGKIHLFLISGSEHEIPITVVSVFYPDGWQYRVDIPESIEELPLTRGLVEVLLLEFANRGSGPKSAELPLWLVESLSCHLLAAAGPRLMLSSVPTGSMRRLIRDVPGADPLRQARDFFSSHSALSFSEMGHPDPAKLTGEDLKAYQYSVQLLLHELVRLPNGKAALLAMLRELPSCWNWETAFLRAFQASFKRMLDAEKWWSVTAMAFLGRDQRRVWSQDLCLQKLEETLSVPAQVRLTANTMPVRIDTTLQQLVTDWDFALQKPVLGQVINQLAMLRYNAPTNVIPLIDAYRLCLHNYLQRRAQAGFSPATRRELMIRAADVIQDTVRQLDELLRQREVLRRTKPPPAVVSSGNE